MKRGPAPSLSKPAVVGLCLLLAIGVYFVLLIAFDRTLFSPRPGRVVEDLDGFQQTILAFLAGGDDPPLWLVARFAIISPLLLINESPLAPVLQGLYLLIFSLPVVLWSPPQSSRSVLQLVLLFIPVFVSFRIAISIYAIAFMFMFIVDSRTKPWALLWYSLAVFLSSSTMFIYLLFFPLLAARRLRGCSWAARILLWLVYLAVVDQFLGKAMDLFTRSVEGEVLSTAAEAGLDYSGSPVGFAMALLTGNPFFTAVVAGQYDRLLLLIPSVAVAVPVLVRLWRNGNGRALGFVLILLASMLSEGVGSYATGVVLFIALVHRKYILRRPRRAPPCPSVDLESHASVPT